jgi:uncharacterized membrane protein YphA (DoxX/SURF4 family)
MDFLLLLARLCFAIIFINSGMGHFKNVEHMGGYAEAKGVPFPKLSVYLSGVTFLLGGLSILLGFWVSIGALLIIVTMLPVTFMMHNFWTLDDPEAKQNDQIHFFKNLSIIGAAFLIWYLYMHVSVPLSLGGL